MQQVKRQVKIIDDPSSRNMSMAYREGLLRNSDAKVSFTIRVTH
jgi:hypothetical protein